MPQKDGILRTEEFSVVSRRRSQLSSHLFWWAGPKAGKREDSMGLEDLGEGGGEVVAPSCRNSSIGDVSNHNSALVGDDMVLVPPLALTRRGDDG